MRLISPVVISLDIIGRRLMRVVGSDLDGGSLTGRACFSRFRRGKSKQSQVDIQREERRERSGEERERVTITEIWRPLIASDEEEKQNFGRIKCHFLLIVLITERDGRGSLVYPRVGSPAD